MLDKEIKVPQHILDDLVGEDECAHPVYLTSPELDEVVSAHKRGEMLFEMAERGLFAAVKLYLQVFARDRGYRLY